MNVSMTNGTLNYLVKLAAEHKEDNLLLMQERDKTVAYYEGDHPSFFKEGRDYEVVENVGQVQSSGFVVMNNIPVSDEGRPVFEDRFKKRVGQVENMEGFQAIRILRPKKGNTYVVFTQWRNEQDFEDWKNSKEFEKAHANSGPQHKQKPSFIDGKPYITKYYMIQPEE
ncbi:antibiotic biosynthesis monooxygenase [Halobacillus sp. Marseille-Q1614]|uniref:antibiotic biosynthesis monooxygenase family protein n=1 Tax=Halobacillus sp. Marseille-Q1614 TaxID=2709134 RepID=UPI00156DAEEC|nr:antibiotic biosynthesis monooxygenase [Halobacillus sp. Marseille-Q1614]